MNINIKQVQYEIRKLGSILITAGVIGFALEDKISALVAFYAILTGAGFVFFGAMTRNNEEEEKDDE